MLNKVIMQGRLTRDPELKQVGDGIDLCKFSIAVSGRKGGKSEVMFMDCQAWRWLAKHINQWWIRGQEIIVEGEICVDTWEKNGEKRKNYYVQVNDAYFCGKKSDNDFGNQQMPIEKAFEDITDSNDDEAPF